VQVFKSALDDRYHGIGHVSSHDGVGVDAVPVRSSLEVAELVHPDAQVIAIDEVQFLDDGIIEVISVLADRGGRVIVAGTDMDFRGEPFGPMSHLMAMAEAVDKLHAICMKCGASATRNQRLVNGQPVPYESPVLHVGGSDCYEARCRRCHDVPSAHRDQTSLLDLIVQPSDAAPILTIEHLRRMPR
jgi:thymidine kinase